jgi:hypothetical protein
MEMEMRGKKKGTGTEDDSGALINLSIDSMAWGCT